MKLADSVAYLSYALKLRELGVRQDSLYYFVDTRKSWKQRNCPDHTMKFVPFCNLSQDDHECELILGYANALDLRKGYNDSEPLSTFTVAESGLALPERYLSWKKENNDGYVCSYPLDTDVNPHHGEYADTEANARAKMRIHLIEKGIIKP